MSEIEARAPATRGRSSVRGARGGLARGAARGGRKAPNGTSHDAFSADESLDDQGEIGEMKKKYSSELSMLKDMFPDWTDVDLVFALDEANGDLPSTVDLITEGNVSQFAEVKKPKDRARSKAADGFSTAGATDKPVFAARGGRGRGGLESTRGGRGGRGSDRARGGFRGGRGGHATTNGAPKEAHTTSVPTTESSAWDTPAAAAETGTNAWDTTATEASKENAPTNAWATIAAGQAAPAPAPAPSQPTLLPAKETAERVVAAPEVAKSSAPAEAASARTKKSWASMFAQPKPPVALPKAVPQAQPAPKAPEPVVEPTPVETPAAEQKSTEETKEPESITKTVADAAASILPQSVLSAVGVDGQQQASEPTAETPVTESAPEPTAQTPKSATDGQEVLPATPHEPLTQENVEHLPDDSHPVSTLTAASTVGSTDPRNLTPVPGQQQPPIGRPPVGGFAISAHRAAATSGRSASFNRRVQEQQEAVVMPGHNAVDRAAVQFGSMGLNGEPGLDVDEEREEPETRQAPQHSPPTQPKASLPAAPRQAATQEPTAPEAAPTPKQAPGLGPASQQNQPQAQESVLGQSIPQEPTHLNQGQNQNYNQYAYGQGAQQDASAQQQKSYDPFGHQAQGQGRYDQYGIQPQSSHSGFGALSSAPNDYSSYYTADPQRNAYSNYYGTSAGYAPQAQQQQDAGLSQQRSASGFGASNESAFGAQAQQQTQSRYGEAPGSGHNTPNPIAASQHQNAQSAPQSQHPMHQAPSHHQQAQAQAQAAYNAGFPYGHPYYNSPYQQAYQNQFGYTQPASGYGGYQGKQQGGMYGSPYGSAYEQHSASPANAGAFSQNQQASMRTGSGMGSQLGGGLDDYSRSAAQSTSLNQTSGFGGVDPFARTTSGFGQNSYAQQPSMTATSQEDALKPFSESKSGPSPSLGQPGRPGSAANSVVGSSQTGVPQQQQQQSAFGGYGGFPSQGSQYGGLGGLGGQQQPQQQQQQQQQQGMGGQGGYGSYGANAFGQYGGYGSQRGGWGQSYGAH